MNELQTIDIDTVRALPPFERMQVIKQHHKWLKRSKKQDKNILDRQKLKVWMFKNKFTLKPLTVAKRVIDEDYSMDLTVVIDKKTDGLKTHIYLICRR